MMHTATLVRFTCDCSSDGRTDVCGESVVGYGRTEHSARQEALVEAARAGWDTLAGNVTYAPGHMTFDWNLCRWVKPVSLVKSYA